MIGINRGRLDFSDYLCRVDLGSQKNGIFNGLLKEEQTLLLQQWKERYSQLVVTTKARKVST